MWLKFESKGGSLTTVIGGRRTTVPPGGVFEASAEEGRILMAAGADVIEVAAPEPVAPVVPEVVVEVDIPEEVPEVEPEATGPITVSGLPASAKRGKR